MNIFHQVYWMCNQPNDPPPTKHTRPHKTPHALTTTHNQHQPPNNPHSSKPAPSKGGWSCSAHSGAAWSFANAPSMSTWTPRRSSSPASTSSRMYVTYVGMRKLGGWMDGGCLTVDQGVSHNLPPPSIHQFIHLSIHPSIHNYITPPRPPSPTHTHTQTGVPPGHAGQRDAAPQNHPVPLRLLRRPRRPPFRQGTCVCVCTSVLVLECVCVCGACVS
jgi:hypothetical protein